MFDCLLTHEQLSLREELRDLVKWVPSRMILDMDQDKVQFPKEFLQEAGHRGLMGVRYPKKWGGREMDWVTAEQKERYVKPLLRGEIFAAECLTDSFHEKKNR